MFYILKFQKWLKMVKSKKLLMKIELILMKTAKKL